MEGDTCPLIGTAAATGTGMAIDGDGGLSDWLLVTTPLFLLDDDDDDVGLGLAADSTSAPSVLNTRPVTIGVVMGVNEWDCCCCCCCCMVKLRGAAIGELNAEGSPLQRGSKLLPFPFPFPFPSSFVAWCWLSPTLGRLPMVDTASIGEV